MKIEHFALNVEDPIAMSAWYTQHLGLQVVRQLLQAPYTTFMADDSGRVMIEIYKNPPHKVPVYREMEPLQMHLAFVSQNVDEDATRLIKAGATLEQDQHLADGSHLIMLRDPWGISIQLCKRAVPMLAASEPH